MFRSEKRYQRKRKIRIKIKGTAKRPRLVVFRSNKHIYGQLIDDQKGQTLSSASDLKIDKTSSKLDLAREIGRLIAEDALKKGIKSVVFDRGGYKYHGRVKSFAEGTREKGLKL